MGKPIRVCLVGAGRVANVHANSLVNHVPAGLLVAVVDNNESALQSLADQYEINNRFLSQIFWVQLMHGSSPRAPEGASQAVKLAFALLRESPGIIIIVGYFTLLPPLLVVFSKFFQRIVIKGIFIFNKLFINISIIL